jgi:hypothetical protein
LLTSTGLQNRQSGVEGFLDTSSVSLVTRNSRLFVSPATSTPR